MSDGTSVRLRHMVVRPEDVYIANWTLTEFINREGSLKDQLMGRNIGKFCDFFSASEHREEEVRGKLLTTDFLRLLYCVNVEDARGVWSKIVGSREKYLYCSLVGYREEVMLSISHEDWRARSAATKYTRSGSGAGIAFKGPEWSIQLCNNVEGKGVDSVEEKK